jgi:acetolactate synthase-1/2/3 large subunit
MFDQAGMLREVVKWDYELRVPEQTPDVVSRAYEATMTSPRGPVYLSLPREPLAAPMPEPLGPVKPRAVPAMPHPDPALIATLAEWIAAAEKPLFITTASGAEAMGPLDDTLFVDCLWPSSGASSVLGPGAQRGEIAADSP